MADTNHGSEDRRILVFNLAGVFHAVLSIGQDTVDVGTLGERIVVTCRHNPAGEFVLICGLLAVSSFCVHVACTNQNAASGNRNVGRNAKAPALELGGESVVIVGGPQQTESRRNLSFVEVLGTSKELKNFEVVVTAEGDRQAVVNVVSVGEGTVGVGRLVVDGVNGQVQVQGTVRIFRTESIVTIAAGFVFVVVRTHAVLSIHSEASKSRSLVGDLLSQMPAPTAQVPI